MHKIFKYGDMQTPNKVPNSLIFFLRHHTQELYTLKMYGFYCATLYFTWVYVCHKFDCLPTFILS